MRALARCAAPFVLLAASCSSGDDDGAAKGPTTADGSVLGAGAQGTPGGGLGGGSVPGTDGAIPLDDALPLCDVLLDDEDAGVSPYAGDCVDERVGVFASPDGEQGGSGSRSHPVKSLQDAIVLAVRTGRDVYACAGRYEGALQIGSELSTGLRLYGGLSCDGFAPAPGGVRSVVHAQSDGPALLVADTHDVVVERFELHSDRAAAPAPGASHVALVVNNASAVQLRDVVLRAADGEPGKAGEAPGPSAPDGMNGLDGQDACSRNPNPGGAPVAQLACGSLSPPWAAGGAGGEGGVGTADGGPGLQQGFPATQGESTGAWGCSVGLGVGQPAYSPGPSGPGRGARGFGALVGARFIGYAGQPGVDGGVGYGGAGGGGARAPSSCAGGGAAVGASGGSGGSSGCSGAGGKGGGAGGSSIGMIAFDARVELNGGEIQVGRGGDGGDGAPGQLGGKGGGGGRGGKGSGGSRAACPGAAGSDGGAGGPGGGGNGGHALGVLYVGPMPSLQAVVSDLDDTAQRGGAAGEGPDGSDVMVADQLRGTPGATARVRAF